MDSRREISRGGQLREAVNLPTFDVSLSRGLVNFCEACRPRTLAKGASRSMDDYANLLLLSSCRECCDRFFDPRDKDGEIGDSLDVSYL